MSGFYVYRSKTAVSEPECKDCPVLFTRLTDIPITGRVGEEKTFSYTEILEKGYRYIYKVTVYSKFGLVSSDSNYVEFAQWTTLKQATGYQSEIILTPQGTGN